MSRLRGRAVYQHPHRGPALPGGRQLAGPTSGVDGGVRPGLALGVGLALPAVVCRSQLLSLQRRRATSSNSRPRGHPDGRDYAESGRPAARKGPKPALETSGAIELLPQLEARARRSPRPIDRFGPPSFCRAPAASDRSSSPRASGGRQNGDGGEPGGRPGPTRKARAAGRRGPPSTRGCTRSSGVSNEVGLVSILAEDVEPSRRSSTRACPASSSCRRARSRRIPSACCPRKR